MYALALLGTGRAGVENTRNAMQAAAIAQDVFQRHPQHPGAAHFIIHSFDDPDHAILGLKAARAAAEGASLSSTRRAAARSCCAHSGWL